MYQLTDRMNWFRLAFQLRGSVAPTVCPRVLLFGGFGFLVSLLYYLKFPVSWHIWGNVVTNVVFNFVLGLLLVFRTNTAYDRFWEGRKSWGTIVVSVRNLARQIWVGVNEVGWGTSLLSALISFVLFGVEQIGNEIEDTFGYDANDLRLDDICKTMFVNVEDLMAVSNG